MNNSRCIRKGTALVVLAAILVMGGTAAPTGAQDFGRLFTTPEERKYLDEHRLSILQPDDFQTADIAAQPIRINGIVTNSDGSAIIWIANDALVAGENTGSKGMGYQVLDERSLLVRMAPSNKNVLIKPGQTLVPSTGEVHEFYAPDPKNAVAGKAVSESDNPPP